MSQTSQEMALEAFVTFLPHTVHGLATLRVFFPLLDARGVDEMMEDAVDERVDVGLTGPGCEWMSPERRRSG